MNDDIDEIDSDAIWTSICEIAGKRADITAEIARIILEDAGQTADNHIGVVEAVDTVLWTVRRKSFLSRSKTPTGRQ